MDKKTGSLILILAFPVPAHSIGGNYNVKGVELGMSPVEVISQLENSGYTINRKHFNTDGSRPYGFIQTVHNTEVMRITAVKGNKKIAGDNIVDVEFVLQPKNQVYRVTNNIDATKFSEETTDTLIPKQTFIDSILKKNGKPTSTIDIDMGSNTGTHTVLSWGRKDCKSKIYNKKEINDMIKINNGKYHLFNDHGIEYKLKQDCGMIYDVGIRESRRYMKVNDSYNLSKDKYIENIYTVLRDFKLERDSNNYIYQKRNEERKKQQDKIREMENTHKDDPKLQKKVDGLL